MTSTPNGDHDTGDHDTGDLPRPWHATRTKRRLVTRTALLGAAERLWAEHGIHGASLDDIASAAGLTKGAVYSNFTGKTDLLLGLLDRYTQTDLGPEIPPVPNGSEPAGEGFRHAGEEYARQLASGDCRVMALLLVELWLYGMRDITARWRIADWYHKRRQGLAGGLAADAEDVSAADRATLALALNFGLTLQHLLDPDRVPAELYATGMRMVLGPALAQPVTEAPASVS